MKRLLLTAGLLTLAVAPSAQAAFLSPQIISAAPGAQANNATTAVALSADGQYAAMLSSATNLYTDANPPNQLRTQGGIFRKDIATGTLELVVPKTITSGGVSLGTLTLGTEPSISANGRFVSFSTSLPRSAEDKNRASDVYVRDMTIAPGDPGAYTLVSAVDGGTAPLTYATPSGSLAVRSAISDDGSRVAFEVVAGSNVGDMTSTSTTSPPGQVVVRDLTRNRTVLLSTNSAAPHGPAANQKGVDNSQPLRVALSADGSTVIWSADFASSQVPGTSVTDQFGELLWKRVADGSAPTTRLAAGLNDPDDPECKPGTALTFNVTPGPCDAPLGQPRDSIAIVQRAAISRDGDTVAIVAAGRTGASPTGQSDAYLVDMAPGLTRKQATTRITAGPDAANGAGVTDIAISPDAHWISFGANHWTPVLNPPSPVGGAGPAPSGTPELLYLVDRAANTVELVSRSYDGVQGIDGSSTMPSVSDGGDTMTFLTAATNLFYGDANGFPDAVVLTRPVTVAPLSVTDLPPPLPTPVVVPSRVMVLSTLTFGDGSVRVRVVTPDGGSLKIVTTQVPPVRRAGAAVRRPKQIAAATARVLGGSSTVDFLLKPLPKFASTSRARGGLTGMATISLTTAGKPVLVKTIGVKFKRNPPTKAKRAPR